MTFLRYLFSTSPRLKFWRKPQIKQIFFLRQTICTRAEETLILQEIASSE